jgi:hypothetical protein
VGHQQHGQSPLVPEPLEQLEDLGLDGDVECGRRLVGHQQLRVARDRDGDHHPLQHAARQLGRDLAEDPLGLAQADRLEQLKRTAVRRAPAEPQFDPNDLGELRPHGDRRVQVGRRVLEHRSHLAAVQALPAPPRQRGHVDSAERHQAALDRAAGRQHAEGGPAGQRLAATGLSDQPDDLPGPDLQRHAAHRGGRPAVHADVQVV